jgi:hypothetical protein
MDANPSRSYEPPAITEVASLEELTLDINKGYAPISDGHTYHHHAINAS